MQRSGRVMKVPLRVIAAAAVASFACASAAGAAGNPWDGGIEVGSPIELALTEATSAIAHAPAPVICWSPADWAAYDHEAGIARAGFVYRGSRVVNLGPDVCSWLQLFFEANPKPNVWCYVDQGTTTKVETGKKRVVVTRRVRGKLKRIVVVRPFTRRVIVKLPAKREVCGGLDQIGEISLAAQTVAHEAIHAGGEPTEAIAECYGRQLAKQVLIGLGAPDGDYAYSVGMYGLAIGLPPEYSSPDCRDGGALDLDPTSSRWP